MLSRRMFTFEAELDTYRRGGAGSDYWSRIGAMSGDAKFCVSMEDAKWDAYVLRTSKDAGATTDVNNKDVSG